MEHNEAVLAAFNGADWNAYRTLVGDATYIEPPTGRELRGEDLIQALMGWRRAFPDVTGTIQETVADGRGVAVELMWRGTHTGPLLTPDGRELAPTGRAIATPAALIAHYEGTTLRTFCHYFDLLAILRAAGAGPPRVPSTGAGPPA